MIRQDIAVKSSSSNYDLRTEIQELANTNMNGPPPPPSPLRLALSDIKVAHSVFALPFALLGACLASPALASPPPADAPGAWRTFAGQILLVIVCMVFARTWAMLVNRIADRRFDAENPRTTRRAVASGALPVRSAAAIALASGALFVLSCLGFWIFFANPWPALLSVPTLAWIAFYSFTKRFTWAAHLFLGGALAFSPIAAAIAVYPPALHSVPAIFWLAFMVLCWVAGFDILYAQQDVDFDRSVGLRSIPATLGPRAGRLFSRALHALAWAALMGAWLAEPRWQAGFGAAAVLVGALLLAEHLHFARRGIVGLPLSFGLINGVIACALGAAGIADLLL